MLWWGVLGVHLASLGLFKVSLRNANGIGQRTLYMNPIVLLQDLCGASSAFVSGLLGVLL